MIQKILRNYESAVKEIVNNVQRNVISENLKNYSTQLKKYIEIKVEFE